MEGTKRSGVIILAAGLGTRMRSKKIKVMHEVLGKPMIDYPIRVALELKADKIIVVVGHQREQVEAHIRSAFLDLPVAFVFQKEQLGTGHAVMQTREAANDLDWVWILSGDVPCIRSETLERLMTTGLSAGLMGFITFMSMKAPAYGRIIRDSNDRVCRIKEQKDCTPSEIGIQEVNAGIYFVKTDFLYNTISRLDNRNAQREFYLTDIVESAAIQKGVSALVLEDPTDIWGVNTRAELAQITATLRQRINHRHMIQGVTLEDPASISIDEDAHIGSDSTLAPGVLIQGSSRIGGNVYIGPYCIIRDSIIEENASIGAFSHICHSAVARGQRIAPYTDLHPVMDMNSTEKSTRNK
jgi:bifunctional UDP-N-acetylglucosamine pyrophosphorylase/glucosamine-1-phosphate N-acetyltransferase